MSRRLSLVYLTLLMALGMQAFAAAPRVAVVDFEDRTGYRSSWHLGVGAADMLTTELVKTTKLEMFEREQIQSVLAEQDFGQSGRVDPSTAAQIGKLVGVDYIITGAITEFGISEGGGGGGGIHIGKKGYAATVDIRMVEVDTGRIVFADSGDGRKNLTRVSVMGFGGGVRNDTKKETEVMRIAIQDLSRKMKEADLVSSLKTSDTPRVVTKPGAVLVAAIDGSSVTLTMGVGADIKVGNTYAVRKPTGVIKDPATGKVIKTTYKTVGKVKITVVASSYADGVLTSDDGVEVGNEVNVPINASAASTPKPKPVAQAPAPAPKVKKKEVAASIIPVNVRERSHDDIDIDAFDEDALEDYYESLKSSVQFLSSLSGMTEAQYEQAGMDVATAWSGFVQGRMDTAMIELEDWPVSARKQGWKILGKKIVKYNKLFDKHRTRILKSDYLADNFKQDLQEMVLLDEDNFFAL